jgi:zinc/manganese transport system substrate-binding protein
MEDKVKNLLMIMTVLFAAAIATIAPTANAKLNVVTSLADLKSITDQVGKDLVSVESIAKGTQDPHFIEAKPSFMVKVNRADLFISIGLDLEVGWLPGIIQGARNPKIGRGQKGFLELGPLVDPLEVRTGNVTRAEGDVHPAGNPHVWLDPVRVGKMAEIIAGRLGEIDPTHSMQFSANAKSFQNRMQEKVSDWQERVEKSGVKKVVTYHKTLTYFFDRFKIENIAVLEPKPGIPPTSGHILEVIRIIKEQKIPLILVENFFDPTVTKKIKADVPSVRTATVAVSVGGAGGINSLDDLYESLVKAIERKD